MKNFILNTVIESSENSQKEVKELKNGILQLKKKIVELKRKSYNCNCKEVKDSKKMNFSEAVKTKINNNLKTKRCLKNNNIE